VIIERPYKDTYHETIIEVDNTRRYSGDYYGSTSSGEGSNLFGVILLLAAVAALVYMEKEHVKKEACVQSDEKRCHRGRTYNVRGKQWKACSCHWECASFGKSRVKRPVVPIYIDH